MCDGADPLIRDAEELLEFLDDDTGNWPSAISNARALTESLENSLTSEVLGTTDHPVLIAPLGVVIGNKIRMISDFSNSNVRQRSVNDFIQPGGRNVKYPLVTWIATKIRRLPAGSMVGIIIDIKGAFNLIPLNPDFWFLLGHKWKGNKYVARNLPFGLASSPLLYSYFAAVILWLMVETITDIVGSRDSFFATVYVDDHMFVVEEQFADRVFVALEELLNRLKIPFSPTKVQRGTTVTFIGYEWDLKHRILKVETGKRASLIERVWKLTTTGKIKRKDAESLAGALQFSIVAAPPCRAFLIPLYRAIHSGVKPFETLHLNKATLNDLEVILDVIRRNEGVTPIDNEFDAIVFSDASLSIKEVTVASHAGFYAIFKDLSVAYSHFELPQCVKDIAKRSSKGDFKLSSTLCESAGVCIALDTLITHGHITKKKILVVCDNQGLMRSLNVGRGLAEATNAAMKTLLLTIAPAGVTLLGLHLPRTTSFIQIADALSRGSTKELLSLKGTRQLVELHADPSRYVL